MPYFAKEMVRFEYASAFANAESFGMISYLLYVSLYLYRSK